MTETEPLDVDRALGQNLSDVMALSFDEVTDGPLEDLVMRYDAVLATQARLKDLKDALSIAVIDAMPEDSMEFQGVGRVNRVVKTSYTQKYKGANDDMRRALAVQVARNFGTDEFTGEIDKNKRDIGLEAIRRFFEFCSIGGPKATAKSIGIDRADYTQVTTHNALEIEDEV